MKHRVPSLVVAISLFWSSAGHASPVYWNLFNFEGESTENAVYITYASLSDMLTDSNRTGSFIPNTAGSSARNVVGSGASILVVPEPASLVLLAIGLVRFVGRRHSAVHSAVRAS